MQPSLTISDVPGEGAAWVRMAAEVGATVPREEIDGCWAFRPIRREEREFGTAVISRVDGDRRRIYTARYIHVIKGKERGGFSCVVEEVGSGPLEALDELLAAVPRRSDEDPPAPVPRERWFPEPDAQASE